MAHNRITPADFIKGGVARAMSVLLAFALLIASPTVPVYLLPVPT